MLSLIFGFEIFLHAIFLFFQNEKIYTFVLKIIIYFELISFDLRTILLLKFKINVKFLKIKHIFGWRFKFKFK